MKRLAPILVLLLLASGCQKKEEAPAAPSATPPPPAVSVAPIKEPEPAPAAPAASAEPAAAAPAASVAAAAASVAAPASAAALSPTAASSAEAKKVVVPGGDLTACCAALATAAKKPGPTQGRYTSASAVCAGLERAVKTGKANFASAKVTLKAQLAGVPVPHGC